MRNRHSTLADGFALLERGVQHPDVVLLLRCFYEEQVGRYGFAEPATLDSAAYIAPHGAFVVAYGPGGPIGCGGFRWYEPETGTVEIKKTFLLPGARGLGVGRALLSRLEDQAAGWGARRAVLETGVRNTVALTFFVELGYQPIDSYVAGRDPAINRAFMKRLSPVREPVVERTTSR
ncbi:acetyltransferase (GNAT) family protein [Micromonospora sp. Llam0]|uniref:GNAT family N-acetyltransferase n=1 Tax=Micromonospora sp. Llam0 TaxID=2485143 RepID=UPI000FAD16D4|nr:GNAT family N-acetyltransferase [Micromonospora sp. Llam0]ROO58917.1 acetyltransferase (GNAT) family protein [Micromonospora sp. Llam0]